MIEMILLGIAFLFTLGASVIDLKTGEIPDRVSIGLLIAIMVVRIAYSGLGYAGLDFVLDGLLVGGIFFAFGAALFYAGGWGGGDAKLMAGIGASIGGLIIRPEMGIESVLPRFFGFLFILALIAVPYSLVYSFIIGAKNKETRKQFTRDLRKAFYFILVPPILAFLALFMVYPSSTITYGALIILAALPFVVVFLKAVEKTALQKDVNPSQLVEGDMVVEDLVINGKTIISKRDMDGLTKEMLKKIQKSKNAPKKIRIKWGIRFAPVFPMALLLLPFWTKAIEFFVGV